MTSYKLTWTGAREPLETAGTALTELLFPPAGAISLTKDDATVEDGDSAWKLDAYFEEKPDIDTIASLTAEHGALSGISARCKTWAPTLTSRR